MKQFYLAFLFFAFFLGFSQENSAGSGIEGFVLYPNPVTEGRVFIETAQNAPKQILIFDVTGEKVLETTILSKELNLSRLNRGVYILRVLENNRVATRKLVVK